MAQKVKVGIIGCGRIASRHGEALKGAEFTELVAVCDLDETRRTQKSQELGVPGYRDYHEMLKFHPEIELVDILTPSGMHGEHAEDLLLHYNKHLMIEKPMTLDLAEAIKIKKMADQRSLRIFPIFQNRYNTAVQRVKGALSNKDELGKLRVGTVRMRWCRPQRYYDLADWRGTWAMDGGALTNQGIHYLDLLRYLCGEVEQVCAISATLGAKIEVEDTAVAILKFKNGALGVIEVMTSARHDDFEASISAVCENGLAVIGGIAANELVTFTPSESTKTEFNESFPHIYGFGHNVLLNEIGKAIRNNTPAPIEFDDAVSSLSLLHALYVSSETGEWVNPETVSKSKLGIRDDRLRSPYRTPGPKSALRSVSLERSEAVQVAQAL